MPVCRAEPVEANLPRISDAVLGTEAQELFGLRLLIRASVAEMQTSEHILLESDVRELPDFRSPQKVHARIDLQSRLRQRALHLKIIDYYYLVVRLYRPRSIVTEYLLDLRFVGPNLQLSRRIASRWIAATFALMALAFGIAFRIHSSAAPWWQHDWLAVCAVLSGMTTVAVFVCVYRTTETVTLYSAHGRAKLLEFTFGLGTIRAVKPFMIKLAAHITLAIAARQRSRAQNLRDEMREHFRLHQAGVLSAEEYEISKDRILAEHLPAAQVAHARVSRFPGVRLR